MYIPPEVMVFSAFRIVAEPASSTLAGTPFAGALVVELLDQKGNRFPEDGREAVLSTLHRGATELLGSLLAGAVSRP